MNVSHAIKAEHRLFDSYFFMAGRFQHHRLQKSGDRVMNEQ
jgi:hypothetical protein